MTKVIIVHNGTLAKFYNQTIKDIGDKYHNYPTQLPTRKGGKIPTNEVSDTSIPKWMTNSGKQVG